MRFNNKIAVITGASRGMGQSIALVLAQEGATVVLTGRDEGGLAQARTLMPDQAKTLVFPLDLCDRQAVGNMVDQTLAVFGRIDILVNNAGGSLHTPIDLEKLSEDDWDRVVDTNLKTIFTLCQMVLPGMREKRYGRVVHVGSFVGRSNGARTVGANYVAAKSAVMALSREIALEYANFNITSNVVAPGLIMSSSEVRQRWNSRSDQIRQKFMDKVPMGRPGEPEEVAHAVAFLASDQASYITGATLDVNGGLFMG